MHKEILVGKSGRGLEDNVKMEMLTLWDAAPYSLVGVDQSQNAVIFILVAVRK
jgi:hypothetical protein